MKNRESKHVILRLLQAEVRLVYIHSSYKKIPVHLILINTITIIYS